ncbi:hypothetical protein [Rhodoferax sp. GW822-FHT02A01]|uniref:hypothetical protein n=1 Tax=Rhodoferax sp. GW822-FHT02A01 TaxID=3141537 RepID=UPI00315C61D8
MSNEVLVWWFFLCVVSAANVMALTYSGHLLLRRQGQIPREVYASRKLQFLLSAGYVLGCAYRSALPVFDVQRICLFDSWFSSVIVGRSVATVAELCFVTQWALLMREIADVTQSKAGRWTSMALVPLIAIAETCSWYSVLTTANIGHVIEESLWGLSAALLVVSLFSVWPRCSERLRPALLLTGIAGVAYVAFMFLVDVPMYWSRWLQDEASGRHYLSLQQGVLDASARWVVSHQWQVWKSEVAWMSLYFSVAVWLSIALIHTPAFDRQARSVPKGHLQPA